MLTIKTRARIRSCAKALYKFDHKIAHRNFELISLDNDNVIESLVSFGISLMNDYAKTHGKPIQDILSDTNIWLGSDAHYMPYFGLYIMQEMVMSAHENGKYRDWIKAYVPVELPTKYKKVHTLSPFKDSKVQVHHDVIVILSEERIKQLAEEVFAPKAVDIDPAESLAKKLFEYEKVFIVPKARIRLRGEMYRDYSVDEWLFHFFQNVTEVAYKKYPYLQEFLKSGDTQHNAAHVLKIAARLLLLCADHDKNIKELLPDWFHKAVNRTSTDWTMDLVYNEDLCTFKLQVKSTRALSNALCNTIEEFISRQYGNITMTKGRVKGLVVPEDLPTQSDTPLTSKPQEPTMVTFTTKHYVNDTEISQLNDEQMIQAVRDAEAELKSLEAIETESKAIKTKIKDVKATIKDIVTHLDAR